LNYSLDAYTEAVDEILKSRQRKLILKDSARRAQILIIGLLGWRRDRIIKKSKSYNFEIVNSFVLEGFYDLPNRMRKKMWEGRFESGMAKA
jgi:hypothetical protein